MAANRYRDGQLNVLGAGQKVRDLIDAHVEASGIDPKVPPISITDPNFAHVVEGHRSNRAKASEMEHAARHQISVHFREDPAHFRKPSQRLEQILKNLEGRWEELVEALQFFTEEVRAGRTADDTGLDPRTQAPFLGLLADQGDGGRNLESLASLTVEMVAMIRRHTCIVDFWRNSYKQERLRGDLVEFLDDNGLVPFEKQEAVADEIAELAKALRTRLCPS